VNINRFIVFHLVTDSSEILNRNVAFELVSQLAKLRFRSKFLSYPESPRASHTLLVRALRVNLADRLGLIKRVSLDNGVVRRELRRLKETTKSQGTWAALTDHTC
jgi:hypothetical protein